MTSVSVNGRRYNVTFPTTRRCCGRSGRVGLTAPSTAAGWRSVQCTDRCLAARTGCPSTCNRTGAAERHPAAVLGAGQAELVPERPQQRRVVGRLTL